jgi:acetyl esterase/lipase
MRALVQRLLHMASVMLVTGGLQFATPSPAEADVLASLFNSLAADGGVAVETGVGYGSHPRQVMDVYRPQSERARQPIVLFLYGGGWTSGERATYRFAGAAFAAQGYTTVIPDYRIFPEVRFPAFVEDVQGAYRFVAERFRDKCNRARPIVVVGHSAGAWLGAMVAHDAAGRGVKAGAGVPAPAAFVGLAGPYAFDPTTWPSTREIFSPAAGAPDRARPIAYARAGAPPSLLVHGGADETVKLYNTRDFASALEGHGNVAQVIEYPGIGHSGLVMALARPLRWRAPVLADSVAFIQRHVAGLAPAC